MGFNPFGNMMGRMDRAEALLRKSEWAAPSYVGPFCWSCHQFKVEGHAEYCELAEAIRLMGPKHEP